MKTDQMWRVWREVVDGEISVINFLIEGGVVGDGGRIDPQFFILFSELGVDPILFCFQD